MSINTDSPMNTPFPWEADAERDISQPPAADEPPVEDRTISDPPADDEDVIEAEIVEADDDEPQPDALALAIADDTRDVALSYRDPAAVATFAIGLRREVRERVRRLMLAAAQDRIDTGKAPTAETYAAEFQTAADVAETLTTVADAIRSGVEVAEDHAAMLVDDVTDPAKRTRSVRVGDGHGRDLKLGLVQGSALSVDLPVILDLVVDEVMAVDHEDPADIARAALDTLLGLISGPSWKSTALDAWKRQLEDAGRHAEAITLGHAYGRVDKGEPRFKIERVDRAKRGAK